MLSLLMCTHRHVTRVVNLITAVNICDMPQHAIIATYRSVKKWNVFIDLELIIFSGSTQLLWIQVSLQSALLCKHECHFVSGISQSNFSIFHNTTESVIYILISDAQLETSLLTKFCT